MEALTPAFRASSVAVEPTNARRSGGNQRSGAARRGCLRGHGRCEAARLTLRHSQADRLHVFGGGRAVLSDDVHRDGYGVDGATRRRLLLRLGLCCSLAHYAVGAIAAKFAQAFAVFFGGSAASALERGIWLPLHGWLSASH